MIKDIYRKYFQKSFNFLYPLLGLQKHKLFKPIQTYVQWENYCNIDSKKLICVFKRSTEPEWTDFEKKYLITHTMLDHCVPVDDDKIAYVFNFDIKKEDYEHFCNGKYSKLSPDSKKMLSNYYGIHTPEWIFIESYLYPEKYYKTYAEILMIDIDVLKEVGELCEKFDDVKETYTAVYPHELSII